MPVYTIKSKLNKHEKKFFVELVDTIPNDDDLYYEKGVTEYYYAIKTSNSNEYKLTKYNNTGFTLDWDIYYAAAKRIMQITAGDQNDLKINDTAVKIIDNPLYQKTLENLVEDPVYIAWSGGWDSTFRLCELIFIEKRVAQPVYIKFDSRPSPTQDNEYIKIEIEVMNRLNKMINEKINDKIKSGDTRSVGKLLDQIIYQDADFTTLNQIIKRWCKYRVRPPYRASLQYHLCALAVEYYQIPDIEISVEKNTKGAPSYHTDYVSANCKYLGQKHQCRQKDDLLGFPDFRYPICHRTKPEMGEIAREQGFRDILERVWTCRAPIKTVNEEDGTITYSCCGICHCCGETIQNDQEYRLKDTVTI